MKGIDWHVSLTVKRWGFECSTVRGGALSLSSSCPFIFMDQPHPWIVFPCDRKGAKAKAQHP